MADNRGGYQKPANPAPVSGPGALSQRTDGGPADITPQPQQEYSGFAYGQNQAINDQQAAAPMAGTPNIAGAFADIVPLTAPTQRPDEPLTAGINRGDGPGSEALRGLVPNLQPSLSDTIRRLAQFDPSGDAELIYRSITDQGY